MMEERSGGEAGPLPKQFLYATAQASICPFYRTFVTPNLLKGATLASAHQHSHPVRYL